MRRASSLLSVVLLGLLLADPATAQSRRITDGRRVTTRQPAEEDRGERPTRRPAIRERDQSDERDDTDRGSGRTVRSPRDDRRIIGPVTVLGGRGGLYDGDYDRYGHSRGRVWGRTYGMSCLQLVDELEWAHDEWHWRNDRYRGARWYADEHRLLEHRIADELAYSGCGRSHDRGGRDCRDRGRYPRTDSALEVAILVLDILLGSGRQGRY